MVKATKRAAKKADEQMVRVGISMPSEFLQWVQRASAQTDVPVSALTRRALREFLTRHKIK